MFNTYAIYFIFNDFFLQLLESVDEEPYLWKGNNYTMKILLFSSFLPYILGKNDQKVSQLGMIVSRAPLGHKKLWDKIK
jgi:hypothetical protein